MRYARSSVRVFETIVLTVLLCVALFGTACTDDAAIPQGGEQMQIEIVVGESRFAATLSGEAAQELVARMPFAVTMNELNANEKYVYLDDALPTDAVRVGEIASGDIMLFGSDCLVLFYRDFPTRYSYTRLGRIDDPDGLASALGGGSVTAIWRKA